MTDPSSEKEQEERSLVPVPYSVLGLGWVVLVIGAGSLAPQLSGIAWLCGPVIIGAKFIADGERFASKKDNPPPIQYNFHAEGVYAAVDQALKTLPGFFEKTSVSQVFENTNPQKGEPFHLEYSVTVRHPDERNKYQKESESKSTLYVKIWIKRMANGSELKAQYKCTGSRMLLEKVIDHIASTIDDLVSKHKK